MNWQRKAQVPSAQRLTALRAQRTYQTKRVALSSEQLNLRRAPASASAIAAACAIRAKMSAANPRYALPALLFIAILLSATATPLAPPVPPQLRALHDVDNIGPAISNATATAIARANAIIARYSDALRIVSIPTGIAVSFFGYFLLAPVLFLAAFISGGGLCFVAVQAVLHENTPAAAWISIAAMLLGGAMLGFVALRALNFGMFAVGASLGVILASCFKTTLIADAYPRDPELAFIIAAVSIGLVFGLLALCLQKQMLIFSTAYAGSAAATFGVGRFAGHFPTSEDLASAEQGNLSAWVVFYMLLALAIGTAGMLFQFWLARDKPMPQYAPRDRRRRRRRVRTASFDDWSDQDDDWASEVYVETVPLPRSQRKLSKQSSRTAVGQRPQVMLQQVATSQSPAQVSAQLAQHSWNAASARHNTADSESDQEQPPSPSLGQTSSPLSIVDAPNDHTPVSESSPPLKLPLADNHTEPKYVRNLTPAADRLGDIYSPPKPSGHNAPIVDRAPASLVHLSLESDQESIPVKVQ